MKSSELLIKKIKEFEGCRLSAYTDSVGVPTIGVGHTKGVKIGQKISMEQAESFLREDLFSVEKYVNTIPEVNTQGKFDALVDFVFNLGSGNLASSTLLKLINNNPDDPAIAKQFKRWVHSGSEVLKGLVIRREKEVELYFS